MRVKSGGAERLEGSSSSEGGGGGDRDLYECEDSVWAISRKISDADRTRCKRRRPLCLKEPAATEGGGCCCGSDGVVLLEYAVEQDAGDESPLRTGF